LSTLTRAPRLVERGERLESQRLRGQSRRMGHGPPRIATMRVQRLLDTMRARGLVEPRGLLAEKHKVHNSPGLAPGLAGTRSVSSLNVCEGKADA
jgi:hypothetical protein